MVRPFLKSFLNYFFVWYFLRFVFKCVCLLMGTHVHMSAGATELGELEFQAIVNCLMWLLGTEFGPFAEYF